MLASTSPLPVAKRAVVLADRVMDKALCQHVGASKRAAVLAHECDRTLKEAWRCAIFNS